MTRVGIRVAMSGVLLLTVCSLSACKPSYGTKETPIMTTAAQEVEIPMDFDQIHNDVLEDIQPKDFPFVKNLVSDEALSVFLDKVMANIANEAAIQDFRYTKSTDTEYGSFFQKYAVHYTLTQDEKTVEDVTVNPGEKFPFKA